MPSSILEAMAAGLPCVVTEVGDNDLVVGDGIGGLVIPPEDINQLIGAIHTLLSDSILCGQMAKAARERSKQYDEKVMVKQLEQVYNHCLV
jgi:glycosyltransferase involved in cell wall biosynthesis